jgi:putative flippase GtrA
MRQLIMESGKYAAVSALALAFDLAILTTLARVLGWNYLVAAAVAFIAGGVLLYFLCVALVFKHRRLTNRAVELPTFVALGAVGLAMNVLVVFIAVDKLHLLLIPAKLMASGCTFLINFLLRRTLLFSPAAVPAVVRSPEC